jgi:hypothetical protein
VEFPSVVSGACQGTVRRDNAGNFQLEDDMNSRMPTAIRILLASAICCAPLAIASAQAITMVI